VDSVDLVDSFIVHSVHQVHTVHIWYTTDSHGVSGMSAKFKFIIGGAVIIAALAWLGFVGFQESKAYYITVDEYNRMKGELAGKTLKLAGDVVAGSVDRTKPQMEFLLGNNNTTIKVRYTGASIIPDTFKDGSKALVEGSAAPNGDFNASHIEAKCASKYESEYDKRTAK
jgi:cytochrome c-type biogenesis protein CcmE